MYKGKRYKIIEKNNFGKIICIYMIIVICILVNNSNFIATFSRYNEEKDSSFSMPVAKFSVKVNEIDISNNKYFKLKLSPTNNTKGNKIVPDSETGQNLEKKYFEIEIDPTGTEVSLEYIFTFDFKSLENLNLIGYTVNNEEMVTEILNNKIQGDILLKEGTTTAMGENDKTTIKVYWEWKKDIENPDPSTFGKEGVDVEAIIRQKINLTSD